MTRKTNRQTNNPNILFGSEPDAADTPDARIEPQKQRNFWQRIGRGERVAVIVICLLLAAGAFGAGLGEKILSLTESMNLIQRTGQSGGHDSILASLNPFAAAIATTATPQLSKEYIYAGSRMLAVQDAAAPQPVGFEGDVSPRPNGDGAVSSIDVSVVQGFQLGLGLPYQSNEFQRADCAPFSSRGDGKISSIDVSQAQAYQLGLNLTAQGTYQPAAGPIDLMGGGGGTNKFESDAPLDSEKTEQSSEQSGVQTDRTVSVNNTLISSGYTAMVPIYVDATGDESVYGFTINYNPAYLSNPVVTNGTAGGSVLKNSSQAGLIGVSVRFGSTIAAGNRLLMNVQFTVAPGLSGRTAIALTDAVTYREVSSDLSYPGGVTALPTTFNDGGVTVFRFNGGFD